MSFTATTPPRLEHEPPISNDGFFPAIDPAAARARMKLDGTVTAQRLRDALVEAIAGTNEQLAAWKAAQVELGHVTLSVVPAAQVDGLSILVQSYQRAVHCTAAASLIERYRSFDATNDGHQYADKLESPVDDLRRDASWALSRILGRSRTTVELI